MGAVAFKLLLLTNKSNFSCLKMRAAVLILCLAVGYAVASPNGGGQPQRTAGDCKTVKKIKYEEKFEQECRNEHREKCTYKTTYKEECSDKTQKVCEKFWKEDGYGGKVWTEDPSKCHWLKESECSRVPHPVKKCNDVVEKVCEKIHKNKPQQHKCQVCGGVEKDCKRVAEQQYHG